MEEKKDLFLRQMSDGTYYWDILRRQVYLFLHTLHGGPFKLPNIRPKQKISNKFMNIGKLAINILSKQYLVKRKPKYIFVTAQRIQKGTSLIDNISDHLFELVKNKAAAIELLNKKSISYWSLILNKETRVPPVAVKIKNTKSEIDKVATIIQTLIKQYFNISVDVYQLVYETIVTFQETKSYYIKMFSKHKPIVVICVNNGTLNGLFSAARSFKIPTIELQHGASNSHTIFWSYPSSISSDHPGLSLPTAYLTFSEYWNANTNYPVKFIDYIGNNYFFSKQVIGREDGVLIISGYMYREELLRFAIELAIREENIKIYFKLHPHEFDEWKNITFACRKYSNIIIICNEMDFHELYKLCNYVVGIHSTNMYLALQAGKKVCILMRSNYFWHKDIFNYVSLINSVDDLKKVMNNISGQRFKSTSQLPVFFNPFSAKRFMNSLANVSHYA